MKKLLFIHVLTLLIVQKSNAKDWLPFVVSQSNYYAQVVDGKEKIESFVLDSVNAQSGEINFFFDTKTVNCPKCFSSLQNVEIPSYVSYLSYNPHKIHKLSLQGDSIIYSNDFGTLVFKPFVKVGEYWETNSVRIECVSKTLTTLFGDNDSIKIFKCYGENYNGEEIVLSKSNGFHRFISFKSIIDQSDIVDFSLKGYKNSATQKGYTPPSFMSYFNLNIGDALIWKFEDTGGDCPGGCATHAIYVDSIINKIVNYDSVTYTYKRRILESTTNKFTDEEFSKTYREKDYDYIFQNGTSLFGKLRDNNQLFFKAPLDVRITENDTVTLCTYIRPSQAKVNMSNCSVTKPYDFYKKYTYSTTKGLIHSEELKGMAGWEYYDVIGSIINGQKEGEAEKSLSSNSANVTEMRPTVYPNPISDVLNIESVSKDIFSIQIYDSKGNIILSDIYQERINTSGFVTGIYLLKVQTNSGKIFTYKIIK